MIDAEGISKTLKFSRSSKTSLSAMTLMIKVLAIYLNEPIKRQEAGDKIRCSDGSDWPWSWPIWTYSSDTVNDTTIKTDQSAAMNQTQAPSRLYRIKMNVNEQLQPHVKFGLPSSPIQKRKNEEASKIFGSETLFQGGIFSPFYRSRACVSLQTYWKGNFSLFWHDNR